MGPAQLSHLGAQRLPASGPDGLCLSHSGRGPSVSRSVPRSDSDNRESVRPIQSGRVLCLGRQSARIFVGEVRRVLKDRTFQLRFVDGELNNLADELSIAELGIQDDETISAALVASSSCGTADFRVNLTPIYRSLGHKVPNPFYYVMHFLFFIFCSGKCLYCLAN